MNGVRGLEKEREREADERVRDNGSKDVLWRPTLARLPTLKGVRGLKSCPNKQCKKVWKCEKERQTKDKGCVVATNFGKIAKPPTLSSDFHNNCSTTICPIVIPSLSSTEHINNFFFFYNIPIIPSLSFPEHFHKSFCHTMTIFLGK